MDINNFDEMEFKETFSIQFAKTAQRLRDRITARKLEIATEEVETYIKTVLLPSLVRVKLARNGIKVALKQIFRMDSIHIDTNECMTVDGMWEALNHPKNRHRWNLVKFIDHYRTEFNRWAGRRKNLDIAPLA